MRNQNIRDSEMSYALTAKELQVTGERFVLQNTGFVSNEDVLISNKKSRSEIGRRFN